MFKVLTVLVLSAAISLGATTAYACHCGGPPEPPLVEYEWADAVFTGIVMSVAPTGAQCGIDFQQYTEYIFYARNGMTCCGLGVALCGRIQPVAYAQEDFDALGPPVASIPVDNETWGAIKELY